MSDSEEDTPLLLLCNKPIRHHKRHYSADIEDEMPSSLVFASPDEQSPVEEISRICRICLANDNESEMISPCLCKGSMKYVHSECLKRWRHSALNHYKPSYYRCDQCFCPYTFALNEDTRWWKKRLNPHLVAIAGITSLFITIVLITGLVGVKYLDGLISTMIKRDEAKWVEKCDGGVVLLTFGFQIALTGWMYVLSMGAFLVGLLSFANLGVFLNFRAESAGCSLLMLAIVSVLGLLRLCLISRSLVGKASRYVTMVKDDELVVISRPE